jgi:predicted amino acid-binding ACT domain protein
LDVVEESLLMVSISGPDRPDILSALAEVMQHHNIEIVDIQQASLQRTVGLHLLLKFGAAGQFKDNAIKDLLFESHRLNLTPTFQSLGDQGRRPHREG